jgi:ribosomal-protein-serine acetyltransferase
MFKADIDTDTHISILESRHADELFALIDNSRESIGQWLSFPHYTKEENDSRSFIEKSLKRLADNNGYWAGIWHNGKIAGSIGYLYLDWKNYKTEIGYWLGKDFVGKGFATKACELFIRHAFSDLRLNKVEINVAAKNLRSRATPIRMGFKEEGIIRDYELLNGVFHDRVVYGLLKKEWQAALNR